MSHNFLNFGRFLAFCFFVVCATSSFAQTGNNSSNTGSGNAHVPVTPLRITTSPSTTLKLSPNPTQHLAVLQLPDAIDHGKLQIFNTTGNLMYEEVVSSTTTLTFDNWQAGVYLIHLTTPTQSYQLKMLITQ